MKRRAFLQLGLTGVSVALTISCASSNRLKSNASTDVQSQLNTLRAKYNVPAIAYGVVSNGSVVAREVIGYRDSKTLQPARVDDLFHIGSNTKAFTAFIAAKLVEDGQISWNTRFFDLYPELKDGSNPAYSQITLVELLCHRARLVQFKNESETYPIVDYEKQVDGKLTAAQKRYHFVKQILKYEPIPVYSHPDDRYSNAGYIAAALMLEKVTGKNWEQQILEASSKLGLGIQIGWPDDQNQNQPKGHIDPAKWKIDTDETLMPMPDALKRYHYFNQYVLLCSPSGNLSISLSGFLKFLQLNIDGLGGKDNYLKADTYKALFTAYPDYSCGWMHEVYYVPCFHHKGSAGTFNSIAIIVPEKKLGIVVMMNTHDGTSINLVSKVLLDAYAR